MRILPAAGVPSASLTMVPRSVSAEAPCSCSPEHRLKPAERVGVTRERFQQSGRRGNAHSPGSELGNHHVRLNLPELVDRDESGVVLRLGDAVQIEQRGQQPPVIQTNHEIVKAEPAKNFADGREQIDLDDQGRRTDRVDVALIELTKSPARGAIGAPDRLNLIALEELRQLVLILRHDTGERHRQIVPEREIRFPAGLVLAALQNLENELVALVTIFAKQRLDVLERRRFERLEAISLVHIAHDADNVLPPAYFLWEKIARPSRWLCGHSW